ncbi:hypothetical protein IG631_23491 [Alternaria alternata]|nr:hypothetical protein IG631_23491 [Alternaria alternata]
MLVMLVMSVMSVLVVFSENAVQYTRYPQDCVQAPDEKCTCNTASGVEQYDNRISLEICAVTSNFSVQHRPISAASVCPMARRTDLLRLLLAIVIRC